MKKSQIGDALCSQSANRREFLRLTSALGIGATTTPFLPRPAHADGSDLEVFTFSPYAAQEVQQNYVDQFGELPSFAMMSQLEEAFNKLVGGYRPDIAATGYEFIGKWRDAGLIDVIDTSRLPNWDDVYPRLQDSGKLDDGKQWAMPFVWGSSSVVFRTDLAPQYIDNHTWEILWDPELAGRIAIKDSAEEAAMPAALIAGVEDPFDMTDEEIAVIADLLREQQKLLRYHWDSETSISQALASGEVIAAFATSDVWAPLAADGVPVAYMAPKEGLIVWMDLVVLVANSEIPDEQRYAYLDALLAPESGAYSIETYAFGHANRKAYDLADPATVVALGMADPGAVLDSSHLLRPYDPTTQEKLNRLFSEIKAGE